MATRQKQGFSPETLIASGRDDRNPVSQPTSGFGEFWLIVSAWLRLLPSALVWKLVPPLLFWVCWVLLSPAMTVKLESKLLRSV